jgi:DNA-binding LacI/PurR family transcriptional regulator
VSQKTVSRVFNDEPTVTEATRDRVLAAAAQRTIHLHRNGAGLLPRGSDPPLSVRRPELTARVVRVLAEGEQ